MPIISTKYQDQNKKAPANQVLVGLPPCLLVMVGKPTPPDSQGIINVHTQQVTALVDTGATSSCIDNNLAKKIGLQVIDQQMIGGAAGKKLHDIYLGYMQIPVLNMEKIGPFIGVELSSHQPTILGRDFLMSCIMIYNRHEGEVTFCA